MTEPLNFAVVGCGQLAMAQHIPNIVRSKKAELHTCCDINEEALAACRERHGPRKTTLDFEEAVRDPEVEAVLVAATEKLRLPVIRAAAEAGKPVYCEKPLARTLEEMYEIERVVAESGIAFCTGHNRRSSPAMREAHDIFRHHMTRPLPCPWRWDREGDARPAFADDGVAGISIRINDDWYSWKGWVFDPEQAPHGPMLFEMTHFTDLANWFLAAEPVEVAALEQGVFNHGAVVRYATGEMATISMYANGTFGYPKELYEMFGNGGAVVVDHMVELRTAGIEGAPVRKTYAMLGDRHPEVGAEGGLAGYLAKKRAACREAAEAGDPSLIFTAEPDKGHARAVDMFVDEILGAGPAVCPAADGILATRVAFAAIKSAVERRAVTLDEV